MTATIIKRYRLTGFALIVRELTAEERPVFHPDRDYFAVEIRAKSGDVLTIAFSVPRSG